MLHSSCLKRRGYTLTFEATEKGCLLPFSAASLTSDVANCCTSCFIEPLNSIERSELLEEEAIS
jgi:hypothetical protein